MNQQVKDALYRARVLELRNWVAIGLVLVVGIPMLEYAHKSYMRIYENYMPATHWFEYRSVVPKQANYRMCDDLTMTSFKKRHREVLMQFTDTLRCDSGDGFYDVDADLWPPQLLPPADLWVNGKDWTYQGARPSQNSLCYFRSTSCAILGYGSDKCEIIKSERFRLNGTQEDCN